MVKLKPMRGLKQRKLLKNSKENLKKVSVAAGSGFDTHIVERFSNLRSVRRPVFAWLLLIFVLTVSVFIQTRQLSNYYIAEVPKSGGVLKEGIVGSVTNINPLYGSSNADRALSRLIFSSLIKYDGKGNLVGDLARKWSANKDSSEFSFTLRDDAVWQDGKPLTIDDVLFTFEMLQHPDSNSPLEAAWRGVEVVKKNDFTVTFKLPNSFAPFPHSLVYLGILPKHILEDVRPDQLRGHRYNLAEPIGSGPFKLVESLVVGGGGTGEQEIVRFRMVAHSRYHLGKPKLDSLILYTYDDREHMLSDFNTGEIAVASGLVAADIPAEDATRLELSATKSDELDVSGQQVTLESDSTNVSAIPKDSQVMLFINTSDKLLKDVKIRQALALAISRSTILEFSDGYYSTSANVILPSQLGFNKKYNQPGQNIDKANKLLNDAGWKLGKDGIRSKNKQKLVFSIVSQSDDIFAEVILQLQKDFQAIGVKAEATIVASDAIQQDYIADHNYQTLLFGINTGRDPDQFAFWHSSQRGHNGRNLSQYDSITADAALVAGRTRADEKLRAAKYDAFQKVWLSDYPALALYQPALIFASKKQVSGVKVDLITDSSDIYHNVHLWTINIGRAEMPY